MTTIMVVDDEPLVRSHVARLLSGDPRYSLLAQCQDGAEALEWLAGAQEKPQIVITDIRMPRMDGLTMIEELRARNIEPYFIILSGYHDFEYTQKAMRQGVKSYLLKPIDRAELMICLVEAEKEITRRDNVRRELQKGAIAQRERFVSDILHGFSMENAEERAAFCGLERQGKGLTLFLIEFSQDMENDGFSIREAIRPLQSAHCVLVPVEDTRLACLWLHSAGQNAVKKAEELRENLCMYASRVTVVIAPGAKDFSQLPQRLREARKTMDIRSVLGPGEILWSRPEPASALSALETLSHWHQEKLEKAMLAGDEQQIREEARQLFAILETVKGKPAVFEGACFTAIMCALRLITERGGDVSSVTGKAFSLQEICHSLPFDQLREWFVEFYLKTGNYLRHMRAGSNRQLSQRVKAFIEEHYAQEVTLASLGKELYFSPVYLGQRFKKETGESVLAFLCATRVEKSKQRLLDTEDPIYEIAFSCGFQTVRGFYLAFKKQENCTPSEWRERMRKP